MNHPRHCEPRHCERERSNPDFIVPLPENHVVMRQGLKNIKAWIASLARTEEGASCV